MNHRSILYNNYFIIVSFIFLLIIPNISTASSIIQTTGGVLSNKDLHTVLSNIRTLFPALTSIILAISFICGIGFVMRAVWLFHTFGQMQMNMNRSHGLSGPFVFLLIGAALIYIPSTTRLFSNTIFGNFSNDIFAGNSNDEANVIILSNYNNSNLLAVSNKVRYDESAGKTLLNYVSVGKGLEWLDLVNTVVMFIQMVGFIAFIRGWFIISHSTGTGAQQGSFSKGLIHLIGGVISINFVPFMQTIADLVF